MFDDMISTAGSNLRRGQDAVSNMVPRQSTPPLRHAVLCGPAIERLKEANLSSLVVTDSIPLRDSQVLPQTQVLTVAPLLGEGDQANPPQRIRQPDVRS